MNYRQLKRLAMVSMVFDHVIRIFPLSELFAPLADGLWAAGHPAAADWVLDTLPFLLMFFGRLAAPVFLFCIALGCRHTRSVRRYLGRLLLTAAVSQLPYVLFAGAENRLAGLPADWLEVPLNILFTMALGLAALAACEALRRRGRPALGALTALAAMVLGWYLPLEGGRSYILLIFVFYYTLDRPRWQRAAVLLPAIVLGRWRLVYWYCTEPDAAVLRNVLLNTLGPYIGALVTLACNGQKGRTTPAFHRLSYALYPAHFALLSLLGYLRPPL